MAEEEFFVRIVTHRLFARLHPRITFPTPIYTVTAFLDDEVIFEKTALFAFRARREEQEAHIQAQARAAVWIAEQFLVEDLDN